MGAQFKEKKEKVVEKIRKAIFDYEDKIKNCDVCFLSEIMMY